MLKTNRKEREQLEVFSIEEFVPQEHLLRKIDSAVNFTHIYDFVSDLYSKDNPHSMKPQKKSLLMW